MAYSYMTFKANTAGVGFSEYLKDNDGTAAKAGSVVIKNTTNAVAYVKVGSGTKPSTPTNAFVPANDAAVATYGIAAGEAIELGGDGDGKGLLVGLQEEIAWVAGWCVGNAGNVAAVGH